MIRKAGLRDLDGILGITRKMAERYPRLRFKEKTVRPMLVEAISGATNFTVVSVAGEEVKGALVAFVFDSLWAERQTATIVAFYTEIPGDGAAMLRTFLRWVRGRMSIKQIEVNIDVSVDERLGLLLGRMGFMKTESVFRWIR